MAVFAKPGNMTFEVSKKKFDQFNQKDTKSAFRDTIKRFELHCKDKSK